MKNNKVTQKDVLYFTISLFLLVVAWIGFNLYHIWATSTINADLQMQIKPIDPSFDTVTIQNLKTREKIVPVNEITGTQQTISPSVSPTPNSALTPTPIQPEQTATESGQTGQIPL